MAARTAVEMPFLHYFPLVARPRPEARVSRRLVRDLCAEDRSGVALAELVRDARRAAATAATATATAWEVGATVTAAAWGTGAVLQVVDIGVGLTLDVDDAMLLSATPIDVTEAEEEVERWASTRAALLFYHLEQLEPPARPRLLRRVLQSLARLFPRPRPLPRAARSLSLRRAGAEA